MRHLAALAALPIAAVALAAPAGAEGFAPSELRAAAAASPEINLLTKNESTLLRTGHLRIEVEFGRVGRVRVLVRVARGGSKKPVRIAKAELVDFRKPGEKVVEMDLTRAGKALLQGRVRACEFTRFAMFARGRRYERTPGRPLFSPLNKSPRSTWDTETKRLGPGPGACGTSRGPAPGGGGAGGGGGSGGGDSGAGGGGGGGGPNPPPLRAGAASSDITPPVGTPMFAYTARSGVANPPLALQIVADPDENLYAKSFIPSRGIHTRVLARAIVLEQGGKKFALVQADLGGLPYPLHQEVVKRIAATGIPPERLLLSATHTHSSTGPIWPTDSQGYALLGGDAFDPRVFDLTAQGITEAVLIANDRLEPARAGMGVAQVRNASGNRNFDPFRLNSDVPADEAAAREVSIDPDVTVLRVDSADGKPLGVWSNFAIHPTSFGDNNLLFSGDNPATAERVAETTIAREAADAGNAPAPDRPPVNVWTNANQGDISPRGGPDTDAGGDQLQYVPNSFASANMAGSRVGDGIVRAWRAAAGGMSDSLGIDARMAYMAFDGSSAGGPPKGPEPVGPQQVLGAGGITGPDGFCAPVDNFAGPGQGMKFPEIAGAGLVPSIAPVAVWRLGRLGIVGLPSEVTRQQGLRIRNALAGGSGGTADSFVLAGLSNSYISYTATPEEYDACHYEGSFTLFGRQQGPRYGAFSQLVLNALLSGGAAPGIAEPPPLAFAIPPQAPVDQTPNAGDVVQPPAPTVKRYERAVFKWHGGDPAVDAPRGQTFISLQREVAPGDWRTVGTDDSYFDTTEQASDKSWTEIWQFTECDPLGTYRFRVTGVADKGSGPAPYERISVPFELQAMDPLQPSAPTLAGGKASLTATYPDPGAEALLALPRRVRTGSARLRVTPPGGSAGEVTADLDADKLKFEAPAPAGSTVEVLGVEDSCGNKGP